MNLFLLCFQTELEAVSCRVAKNLISFGQGRQDLNNFFIQFRPLRVLILIDGMKELRPFWVKHTVGES